MPIGSFTAERIRCFEEGGAVEPAGAGAYAIEIGAGDAGPEKELVDRIEESPGAVRVYGDVAVEFAGGGEGVALANGDGIFEPEPVFRLAGTENESRFAAGVIVIPVGIPKCLIDAVTVERAHEALNAHAGGRGIGRRVRPGGEPTAVVELAEDGEVRDDARAEFAARAGKDFGDDGVVDVDVERCLAVHERQVTGEPGDKGTGKRGRRALRSDFQASALSTFRRDNTCLTLCDND